MSLQVLDLFCGAGGFSLGFKRAQYDIVGAIDYDIAALNTYQSHHDNLAVPADLFELLGEDGPDGTDLLELLNLTADDVDVVIGGPPCQGFSKSSDREPDDPINDLIWTYLDVVAAASPSAFVMENVPGFLSHKEGNTVSNFIDCANGLGYDLAVDTLVASDFEVPQTRERVIIIGMLPSEGSPQHPEPAGESPNVVQEELTRANFVLPDNEKTEHKESSVDDISELEYGESWFDKSHQVRLDPRKSARTITASNRHIHPFQNRELTIRECAILQSFPPEYGFTGTREERTEQVGNAVPPKLAEHIALAVRRSLDQPIPSESPTESVGMSVQEIANLSGRLTEREVEAVLLRSGGLSWQEVGDEMGVTLKTASNLYYRAEDKVEEAHNTIKAFNSLTSE